MKHLKLFGISLFFAVLFFSACESVDEAQVAADEFYEAFNMEDDAKMESLLDKDAVIDAGIKDQFFNVFSLHMQTFGKVTSYIKDTVLPLTQVTV